jgi:hypothetical protein
MTRLFENLIGGHEGMGWDGMVMVLRELGSSLEYKERPD